jgi:cerevisin
MKTTYISILFVFWLFESLTALMDDHYESYIVVFKPNVTSTMVKSHLSSIQKHSSKPIQKSSSVGKMQFYIADMSSTGLHELSNNHTETVDYFVKDEIFRIQELVQPNPPNWGLDRIDRRTGTDDSFAFPTSSGEGVDVYVLDTGVNAQHIDLVGRVISAPSFVNGSDDSSDSNGHGTFVAGVCCGKFLASSACVRTTPLTFFYRSDIRRC